jgi:hypothetical protein
VNWIASGEVYGFVCAEVTETELTVKFLNQNCELLKEVTVVKNATEEENHSSK